MNDRDLRKVDLHAHVAPGHHDAVRHGQDIRQVADALPVFDLGDDADMEIVLVQDLPQLPDVGGGADKAGGDIVKALLDAEEDILPVPLADIGHGQADAGDVDALVVLHDAAVEHLAANGGGRGLQYGHADQAVIQQDAVTGLHVAGQVIIRDGTAGLVAFHFVGTKGELRTLLQLHGAVFEALQPHLGALGVQHGGHGQVQLLPQGFQLVQPGLVTGMVAVGEVEAGHVHAGEQHLPQDALPVRGRSQGADDLCLSHIDYHLSRKEQFREQHSITTVLSGKEKFRKNLRRLSKKVRHFCRTFQAKRLDVQFFFQRTDHVPVLLLRQVHRLGIGDLKAAAKLKAALVLGYDVEMEMGIGIAEGSKVQLRAAPQVLDGLGSPSQVLGEIRPLLGLALPQLPVVALQRQHTAAFVGLVLEQVQRAGLHLADLEHNGLPALVMLITVKTTHGIFLLVP